MTSVKQDLSQLNLNLESGIYHNHIICTRQNYTFSLLHIHVDLLTVPPSFEKGMTFDSEVKATQNSELAPPPETVNISEVLLGGGDMVMEWGGGGAEEEEKKAEDLKTEALQQVRFLHLVQYMYCGVVCCSLSAMGVYNYLSSSLQQPTGQSCLR